MEETFCMFLWRKSFVCFYGGKVLYVSIEERFCMFLWRKRFVCFYGGKVLYVSMEEKFCMFLWRKGFACFCGGTFCMFLWRKSVVCFCGGKVLYVSMEEYGNLSVKKSQELCYIFSHLFDPGRHLRSSVALRRPWGLGWTPSSWSFHAAESLPRYCHQLGAVRGSHWCGHRHSSIGRILVPGLCSLQTCRGSTLPDAARADHRSG